MHSMSILRCIQKLTKYYAYVQENATLAKGKLKLVVYSAISNQFCGNPPLDAL